MNYDGYLGSILELLERGVSDDEIATDLHRIVTVTMGLSASVEAMRDTVVALRRIKLPQRPG
jgi:hypothetical protein